MNRVERFILNFYNEIDPSIIDQDGKYEKCIKISNNEYKVIYGGGNFSFRLNYNNGIFNSGLVMSNYMNLLNNKWKIYNRKLKINRLKNGKN
jgi:hypothetical protein